MCIIMAKKSELDEMDHRVIRLLKENSRISISDISRDIEDLAESTLRYRLEKLEKEGYIKKFTIVLDQKRFGKNIAVIFNLKVLPEDIPKVFDYLTKIDDLTRVFMTTGIYSIVAVGYFEEQSDLTDFITQKLKNIPVTDFDIAQILKEDGEMF